MIIFENAVYFEKGKAVTINYEELSDMSVLLKAKSKELWESEHKNYRIFPHIHEWEWRFASLTNSIRAINQYKEATAEMRQYAESLKIELNSNSYSFITFLKDQSATPTMVTLLNSHGYKWQTNVLRDLSHQERIEHDLFGHFPAFETAERIPLVGIELIGKDFPNDYLMVGMLEATAAVPYYIFLDFIEAPNCLLKLDKPSKTIKSTYFIYDGYLWKDCKKLNVSGKEFEQMVKHDIEQFKK